MQPPGTPHGRVVRIALLFLVAGALGIGFAPVLAKLAVNLDGVIEGEGLSPVGVAFWRMLMALPVFLLVSGRRLRPGPGAVNPASPAEPRAASMRRGGTLRWWHYLIPGTVFAADLGIWHWSFEYTSVANATLGANLAVIMVSGAGWWLFGERFDWRFPAGAGVALAGTALLVGASVSAGGDAWIGDLLSLSVAVCYASYQVSIKYLVRTENPERVMLITTAISAVFLWLGALVTPGRLLPATAEAWWTLAALALASQVVGQGLIARALMVLPAGLSSVVLILQPLFAAILGWLILAQALTPVQLVAGSVILCGIWTARRGSRLGER